MEERRRYSRVTVSFDATLTGPTGIVVRGSLRNVGILGAFIGCEPPFAPETPVKVDVTLHGATGEIHLRSRATVVHQQTDGLGIAFTAIDAESVAYLRNVIAYHADDPEAVLAEIRGVGT